MSFFDGNPGHRGRNLLLPPSLTTVAPTFVGISASPKNVAAFNATLPAGNDGDLLVLFSVAYAAETGTPAGYTLLGSQNSQGGNLRAKLFGRIATGADTAAFPSIAWQQVIALRMRGASIARVFPVWNFADLPGVNTCDPPTNAPTTADNYFAAVMAAGRQNVNAAGYNFTSGPADLTNQFGWTSGQDIEPIMAVGYRALSEVVSYDPGTFTGNQIFGTNIGATVLIGGA